MATFDGSVVNVALPTIAKELGASVDLVAWVALSYSLTLVALIMLFGSLTESKGYAFAYKFGYIFFILGSLLCGLSTSIYALILSRILQATGTAMFAAVGLGMVTEIFPENERGKAIGMIVMTVSAGFIIGPPAGGLLLSWFSWQSIFFINIPIGLVGLTMAFIYFKKMPVKKEPKQMRWAGPLSISLALVTATFALRMIKDYPITDLRIWGLGLVSLFALVAFIKLESNEQTALIGFDIFKNRQFTFSIAAMLAVFASISGLLLLVPFFLENVKGLKPDEVAFFLVIIPVLMFIFAPLSGKLSDKIGPRILTTTGVMVLIGGLILFGRVEEASPLFHIALALGVIGAGIGLFTTPNSSALMGSVHSGQRAITSGIVATSRNIGLAMGVAISTAMFAFFQEMYADIGIENEIFVASFRKVALLSVAMALVSLPFCIARGNRLRETKSSA